MSNLHRTTKVKASGENADESDEEEDDEDDKPELETAMIKHTGSVNRLRVSVSCFVTLELRD